MLIIAPWDDEALRGGDDRVLYVNGTTPELQLCKNTDWAGINMAARNKDKTSTRKGP